MAAFDRLPAPLRAWLAAAHLPWSPHSAARTYRRLLAETRDAAAALHRLSAIEGWLLARDACRIGGPGHPSTTLLPDARQGP